MFSFISAIAIVALFALLVDTRSRLKGAEATLQEAARRIGALQRHTGLELAGFNPMGPVAAAPLPETAPAEVPKDKAVAQPEPVVAEPAAYVPEAAPEAVPVPETPPVAKTGIPDRARLASGFEDLFGRKLPIWAGGVTLAIAGVLIVKYAIDAGFFARIFTHGAQVISGLLFGGGLIAGAEFAWRNEARVRDVRVPQALSGAGIATLYASILVAANAYHLIAPLPAFIALAAITAAALGLSLRFGAPSAVLGLVGGLAAPSLVGSDAQNVPVLAIYLGLTIAGLAGVARTQRWPWLAALALLGGAGWNLGMILIGGALNVAGSLSVGALVLLLAIALPALALDGPRNALSRAGAAVVGAVELAVLVAHGGFAPLDWGLFALLALAGQWLAWRAREFAIVPRISLALCALLLTMWPNPGAESFALIALSLATIHAVPLLARLWRTPAGLAKAAEISAIALAAPVLTKWQFTEIADSVLALTSLGGAALPALAIVTGWHAEHRQRDARFAMLTATTGGLIALTLALLVPAWAIPLAIAAIASALLFFGRLADDPRIEPTAFGFAVATLPAVLATMPLPGELAPLVQGAGGSMAIHAVARWGVLAAVFALFAARSRQRELGWAGQIMGGLLGYGAVAQIAPLSVLPLAPAVAGAALLMMARRPVWTRVGFACASFAAISLAWAIVPATQWSVDAAASLIGEPMTIDAHWLGLADVVRRMAVSALLFGAALWLMRSHLHASVRQAGLIVVAIVGGMALHCLYRLGFAQVFGTDFADTGLAERLILEALLIGGAWLAGRRAVAPLAIGLAAAGTAHTIWYTLLLHDPLWAAQAVGAWPVANLLIPAFVMAPLGIATLTRQLPNRPAIIDRLIQGLAMLLIALFAWASLRQAFHGTWLNAPGTFATENILRSLLILGLAIGYLLWGIRKARHDWRIASLVLMLAAAGKVFLFDASGLSGLLRIGSFVALGFALIGIGWLYSRQFAQSSDTTSTD